MLLRCDNSAIMEGSFSSPLFQGSGPHFPFHNINTNGIIEISAISDVFIGILLTLILLYRTHTELNN